MGSEIERLLERYEEYLDEGLRAYDSGNPLKAREYLLLAAERLFEMAALSAGELREARLANAAQILEQVEAIDREVNEGKQRLGGEGEGDAGDKAELKSPVAPAVKPETRLDDVAGLENVKKLVREKLIDPFLFPDLTAEFGTRSGGGILLYGPPGTGKTLIARAIAGEVDAAFFPVYPSDIMSKWVGDPEKNVRALFAEARRHEKSVIFFDEIDGLAPGRQRSEDYMRRLVNQLLAEIQGFDQSESSILFIGATNHPQLLDHAMLRPGRLDELVYIPLPDAEARHAMWSLNLSCRKRGGRFDYEELAELSDGYSGAEIALICDKAAQRAMQRYKSGDEEARIEMSDVLDVLELIAPRTSQSDIGELMAFARQFDRNMPDLEKTAVAPESPETAGPAFRVRPDGALLENLLESLLALFPREEDLIGQLTRLFEGRHVSEIVESLAAAVNEGFGAEKDPVDPDCRLSLGHFVRPARDGLPPDIGLPLNGPGGDAALAGDGRQARDPGLWAHHRRKNPLTSAGGLPPEQEEEVREALAAGLDLLERYSPSLSDKKRDELTDYLYSMVHSSGQADKAPLPDMIAFEGMILLAIKEEQGQPPSGEPVSSRPGEGPRAELTRKEAMGVIARHRDDLTVADLKGLAEEVVRSRVIDIGSFASRVARLAEANRREHLEKELRALLDDRRDFLAPDEIRGYEKELESASPDYEALLRSLQERTYRRKLEKVVEEVSQGMSLPGDVAFRLRRKCVRALERSGEMPTPGSVRTRMKALLAEQEAFQRQLAGASHEQAPVIDDVRHLVLPPSSADFSDVAGMDVLKDEMEFAVEVPINPEKRSFYTRITGDPPENAAMLLYGTPGCGKTFLAKCAAMEFAKRYGFTVILVPIRAIDGLHYTKKCPRIVEIFNLARSSAPSIAIWDEFDGIASPPMFSNRKYNATICSELKSQFEGMVKSGELVVHIATSNYPWDLEPALMRQGRLGRLIHVLPPDLAARRETMELMLMGARTADDVDYDELAARTEGMTISEIRKVVKAGLDRTVRQGLASLGKGGPPSLGMEVLLGEIERNPPADFRTWLATARRSLGMPKYEAQREFFQGLLGDVERFLGGKGPERGA